MCGSVALVQARPQLALFSSSGRPILVRKWLAKMTKIIMACLPKNDEEEEGKLYNKNPPTPGREFPVLLIAHDPAEKNIKKKKSR